MVQTTVKVKETQTYSKGCLMAACTKSTDYHQLHHKLTPHYPISQGTLPLDDTYGLAAAAMRNQDFVTAEVSLSLPFLLP